MRAALIENVIRGLSVIACVKYLDSLVILLSVTTISGIWFEQTPTHCSQRIGNMFYRWKILKLGSNNNATTT